MQVTSNTTLLEEILNISKVLAKSLLRVKMVMCRNTEFLAFLLQILYADLNLWKTKSVRFVNHVVLIITSGMMTCTIFFVFWETLAVQKRNYDKMCMLPMPFFRSASACFWWCLRNWEVGCKDLYRNILWHVNQHKVCVCMCMFHICTEKIHFQGWVQIFVLNSVCTMDK